MPQLTVIIMGQSPLYDALELAQHRYSRRCRRDRERINAAVRLAAALCQQGRRRRQEAGSFLVAISLGAMIIPRWLGIIR